MCFASQQPPLLRPALLNFRSTQPPHSPVPIVRTSPYKSVQVRIPLPAPCALHTVLCQPTVPLLRPSSLRCTVASPVLRKFRSPRASHRQVPIVGQVRPVRPVRHTLPAPCALHKVLCQPTAPLLRPSTLRYAAASQVLRKFSFFLKKTFPLLTLTINLAIINMCPYLTMFA